jgi:hypothetical protein
MANAASVMMQSQMIAVLVKSATAFGIAIVAARFIKR